MKYKQLKCQQCENGFVWSEEEQALYQKRGLDEPKFCPICRGMIEARKQDEARNKYGG